MLEVSEFKISNLGFDELCLSAFCSVLRLLNGFFRMTLRLQSCDGQVFSVPVSEAKKFGTIRNMLENLSQSGTDFDEILPLPNVDSSTLKTLIDWSGESDTLKLDENSRLLDLVMAANYLDVPKLVDLGCQQISSLIRGKSAEEMKKAFGLKSCIAEETLAFHVVPLNDRFGIILSTSKTFPVDFRGCQWLSV